jgi:voltage-gated potassium channel Kch
MAAKFVIFFLTIDRFKFTPETSFRASVNMGQISEFGLILMSLAITRGYVEQEVSGFISMVAILTMGSSAYLMRDKDYLEQKVQPVLDFFKSEEKQDVDVERLEDHVVVIGYEENTKRLCRKLSENHQVLVVDDDPANTEELAESDYEYIYGDFKHGEIREGANLQKAKYIISFSKEKQVNIRILEERRRDTVVIVKADNFEDASEFYDMGADYVIIENVLAGNRISEYVDLYLEDRELFIKEVDSETNRGEEESQN